MKLNAGETFGTMDGAAEDLLDAARPLLATFEQLTTLVMETPNFSTSDLPAPLLRRFRAETADYVAKFKAWQAPDALRMAHRVEQALLAVILAQRNAPPETLPEILVQRQRLASSLVKLRGPGALEIIEAAARASGVNI